MSLPAIKDRRAINSVVDVPLRFPRLSGSTIRFTVEAVRQVTTINWYSEKPITMPVGIAEVGLPGVHFTPESPTGADPGRLPLGPVAHRRATRLAQDLGPGRCGREAREGLKVVRLRARRQGHHARGRDPHTGGDLGQDHRLEPRPARARLRSGRRGSRPARGRHGCGRHRGRSALPSTPRLASPDCAGARIVGDLGQARGRRRRRGRSGSSSARA